MGDKRGISEVISTVLMILLVLAAIVILWVVISNFLNKGTVDLGGTVDCVNTNLKLGSAVSKNNSDSWNVTGNVQFISGSTQLTDLIFYVNGLELNSSKVLINALPKIGESRSFILRLENDHSGHTLAVAPKFGDDLCSLKSNEVIIQGG